MEGVMSRNLAKLGVALLVAVFSTSAAAQFGTEEEAKAMLTKAVAALKENKATALEMFNKGDGGFKDRDLYVFCANASDGVLTAHPYYRRSLELDSKNDHAVAMLKKLGAAGAK
jgi:hypothetical protein